MNRIRSLLLLILCCFFINVNSQSTITNNVIVNDGKMQWFADAKLGIFIHWGIYAVNGIDESWSFYNGYISYEDYLKQLDGFTAENYKPDQWTELIKKSGAKYAVITSRHHDGFALWDTKFGNLNANDHAASRKDLLTPFVKSLRKKNIKVGLYYSLSDWSHEDYTHFKRDGKRYTTDSLRWVRFLDYYQGQLTELIKRYHPDLFWFDGDWEHSAEEWQAEKVRNMILEDNPDAILNSRLQGYGDYATPEQGMPVTKPRDNYWELCLTMNDSWGYQHNDKNYKSAEQIIWLFADVIGNGGNLLLDIGPKADGTIPEEQEHILKELGIWTGKHQEAIIGTVSGIPLEHYYGPTTLSKDSTILYLFVKGNPGGQLVLKGIRNKINRIYVVGKGTKLEHNRIGRVYWSQYPGILYIDIPDYVLDETMTVVAVMLDGPVELYREGE